jgi:hypothetical protein
MSKWESCIQLSCVSAATISRADCVFRDDPHEGNDFVYKVLDTLHTADISPTELIFDVGHGITTRFSFEKFSTILLNLRTLCLNVRGTYDQDDVLEGTDWDVIFGPIQHVAKRLEALSIYTEYYPLLEDACIDRIFYTLRLPHLKYLHLDCGNVRGTTFAKFVEAHDLLEGPSHNSRYRGLLDYAWTTYWKARR